MNITQEKTGDYTASLIIDLTPEDYLPKVNENLEKIRKKANIPGFRPGKAPMGLVKRHYGKTTILEEVNQMAFENIYKHVEDNKIRVIGRPLINIEKTPKIEDLTEDQTYSFVFDIGILPEFEVNVSNDVEVEYKKVSVNDVAVEKEIEALRTRNASFDKSNTITEECMVTGNLEIFDPSVEMSEEEKEKSKMFRYFQIEKLKDNPKIHQLFLGAKTGDIIDIKLADIENRAAISFLIPESVDISKEGLQITFIPAESYTSQPAELNEEFFSQNFPGKNITTEEEFRSHLREELDRHFEHQCDDIFLHSVRKKLISETELPLPADFVKRFLIENSKEEDEQKITDLEEKFDDYLEIIKWEFIQDKIFENFEIKIGADDFRNYIRDFYSVHLKQDVTDEQIQSELKNLLEDKKRMESIEQSIRRTKSLELFKTHLTIKETQYASFEELTEAEKVQQEKDLKTTKND